MALSKVCKSACTRSGLEECRMIYESKRDEGALFSLYFLIHLFAFIFGCYLIGIF